MKKSAKQKLMLILVHVQIDFFFCRRKAPTGCWGTLLVCVIMPGVFWQGKVQVSWASLKKKKAVGQFGFYGNNILKKHITTNCYMNGCLKKNDSDDTSALL